MERMKPRRSLMELNFDFLKTAEIATKAENASFTLDEYAMQNDFLANLHQNGLAFLADYSALWLLGLDMMQTMNNRQLQQEMKLFISRGSNCTMEALIQGQFPLIGDGQMMRQYFAKTDVCVCVW
ncbi:hypothetical protein niasHT_000497 [Heterodera trifolii]|uniref:Uncharacterized protein n=1 Tax=Heterodera trifolii TaxID=157864 RepID=A0ABD2LV42_9BILA